MEHNENQDFEQLEECNDDIGYEDYNDEMGYEESLETIDGLVENAVDEGFREELAEQSFDGFVLDEVIDQTELAQPEYLDAFGSNLYEDRTDEYVAREMTDTLHIEIPEDIGIGEKIDDIDIDDVVKRMLEQSNRDFANNEKSYQENKEFDRLSKRFVPKSLKRYGSGKSQKEVMRGNWVGYNTAHKSYRTSRRY